MIQQTFNVTSKGKPVVGATVTATPDDPSDVAEKGVTDKAGNVTMQLDPGTYNVRVYHAGNQEAATLIVGTHANPFPILMK